MKMKTPAPAKKSGPKPSKVKRAAKPKASAKSVAAKPTAETPKRKGKKPGPKKKKARAAAAPRKARAPTPIVKKVIQGADAQALKVLVESVKSTQLDAEKSFISVLEHWPVAVRERARAITEELGMSARSAGQLAIRVAQLEVEGAEKFAAGLLATKGMLGGDDATSSDSMPASA